MLPSPLPHQALARSAAVFPSLPAYQGSALCWEEPDVKAHPGWHRRAPKVLDDGARCACCARRSVKSVVFVLDEFDLFAAKRSKQTLLYNLLDALQTSGMQASQPERDTDGAS